MSHLFKEKIDAGIKYLDENRPNWFNEIDLQRLSMIQWHNCILGQLDLWKDFFEATVAINHGFDCYESYNYSILDSMWKEVILERRKRALEN